MFESVKNYILRFVSQESGHDNQSVPTPSNTLGGCRTLVPLVHSCVSVEHGRCIYMSVNTTFHTICHIIPFWNYARFQFADILSLNLSK